MTLLGFSDRYYFAADQLCEINGGESTNFEITVYEVFKVISGLPLFFSEHMLRLENSLKHAEITDYKIEQKKYQEQIAELCNVNQKHFGNIELRVSKSKDGDVFCYIGFIKHAYPNPIAYIEGVKTDILKAERNKPNAKIKHSKTRLKANRYIEEHGAFEVLLENSEGELTEGSRSNLFFIKDETIYSAPIEHVLPGITRLYTVKAINKLGYSIINELVRTKDLNNYDAAFLCGTSLGILPIKQIKEFQFSTQNNILRAIMQEFNSLVSESLTTN